jgi:hypothetical protein
VYSCPIGGCLVGEVEIEDDVSWLAQIGAGIAEGAEDEQVLVLQTQLRRPLVGVGHLLIRLRTSLEQPHDNPLAHG